jgi:hypothetical protein
MLSTKFDRAARQQAHAAIIDPKEKQPVGETKEGIKLNRTIYLLKCLAFDYPIIK